MEFSLLTTVRITGDVGVDAACGPVAKNVAISNRAVQ